MAQSTPWAFVLFKWQDNDREPNPREFYEKIFTNQGRGTHNIVDYWESASHNHVDLSENEVIGWVTIDDTVAAWRADQAQLGMDIGVLAQYKADKASQQIIDMAQAKVNSGFNRLRHDVMQKVRKAASNADFDLTQYYGVVAVSNVSLDLWGKLHEVMIDGSATNLSGLAHEMGHGYGLNHSMDTRYQDYTDWWDVMSYGNCAMVNFPDHGFFSNGCGPMLNASNMERLGWLDASRVFDWNRNNGGGHQTIPLTALTSPDGPGYLAARIDQYLVEFRMPGKSSPCLHDNQCVNCLLIGRSMN
jgi:M6 family metalloprotease-like protein